MSDKSDKKEIWHILRCCVCKRCLDKETGKIVAEPADGIVMSHTYCPECKDAAMEELDAEAAKMAAMQRITAGRGLRYRLGSRR